jgi:hypothetical protein
MEAIKFKGCDDYLDIPFLLDRKKDLVITCYKLSFIDLLKVILTRKIWIGEVASDETSNSPKISVNRKNL